MIRGNADDLTREWSAAHEFVPYVLACQASTIHTSRIARSHHNRRRTNQPTGSSPFTQSDVPTVLQRLEPSGSTLLRELRCMTGSAEGPSCGNDGSECSVSERR